MIYLKRLWNCIVLILSVAVFSTMLPLIIFEVSIISMVYYIMTGENYMDNYFPVCAKFAALVHDALTFKGI